MIQARKQEVITTIQEIQKRFSVQDFDNKFVSIIKHYINNSEDVSYYDMRNQLDMDFSIDMNPIFMYIINAMSISYPNINAYIKVIDKIKLQYGTILHRRHEAAINPLFSEEIGHMEKATTTAKHGKAKCDSNIIPFTTGSNKGSLDKSTAQPVDWFTKTNRWL